MCLDFLGWGGVVYGVHEAWKLGRIAHGNEFGNASKRAREDGCAVRRLVVNMNDIAVCVEDIADTTKLSVAMFEPGPRRSAIHAVLVKDTSDNVGHDLAKVLYLLGAEIGGG